MIFYWSGCADRAARLEEMASIRKTCCCEKHHQHIWSRICSRVERGKSGKSFANDRNIKNVRRGLRRQSMSFGFTGMYRLVAKMSHKNVIVHGEPGENIRMWKRRRIRRDPLPKESDEDPQARPNHSTLEASNVAQGMSSLKQNAHIAVFADMKGELKLHETKKRLRRALRHCDFKMPNTVGGMVKFVNHQQRSLAQLQAVKAFQSVLYRIGSSYSSSCVRKAWRLWHEQTRPAPGDN